MLFHVKAGARENLLAGGGQRAGQRHDHTDLDSALRAGAGCGSDRNCDRGGSDDISVQHDHPPRLMVLNRCLTRPHLKIPVEILPAAAVVIKFDFSAPP